MNKSITIYDREDAYVSSQVDDKRKLLHLDDFSFYWDKISSEARLGKHDGQEDTLDLFYVFFEKLLPRCRDASTRTILVKKLNGLIFNTTYIKGYCSENHWVRKALNYLESHTEGKDRDVNVEVLTLVQIISLFSISPLELKIIFLAIHGSDWAKPYWHLFVQLLQRMALPREGPDFYFDFNGLDSGMMLPSVKRWPVRGYTFFSWLRIESFEDPLQLDDATYHPRLYSFLSDDGHGLEVYMVNKQVVIKTITKHKEEIQIMKPFLETKKWYFVCISHQYHRFTRSEVSLYLDGKLCDGKPLAYPRTDLQTATDLLGKWASDDTQDLSRCHLANNDEIVDPNYQVLLTQEHRRKRPQPFYGQMGAILLLEDAIPPSAVAKIYELGANLTPRMNDDLTDTLTGQKGSLFYLDRKVLAKIMFSYNPKASDRMMCMDTASGLTKNNATKMGGVKEWSTRSINQVIDSIGGIKTVVTLFGPSNSSVEMSHDPAPVFAFLLAIAQHDPDMFQELYHCQGLQIMGYLLERIHPEHITEDTVTRLDQLGNFVIKSFGEGDIFLDVLKNVLFNCAIWVRALPAVQVKLFAILTTYCHKWPHLIRTEIGVESILDILHYFYFTTPEKPRKVHLQQSLIQRKSLIATDTLELRQSLIHMISVITEGQFRTEEVMVIMKFLRESVLENSLDVLEALHRGLLVYFDKADQRVDVDRKLAAYLMMLWSAHPVKPTPNLPRRISIPLGVAYNREAVGKKWRRLLKNLHRENEQEIYWKLDDTENNKRMRRRLKRQYNYNLYQGCARSSNSNVEVLTEDSFVVVNNALSPEAADTLPNWQDDHRKKSKRHYLWLSEEVALTYALSEPQEMTKEGFLVKKSGKLQSRKVRYFVLSNSKLEYKWEGKLLSTIDLQGARVWKNEEDHPTEYCFHVETPHRLYYLYAETRLEMEEWIRDIKIAIPSQGPSPYSENPDLLDEVTLSFLPSSQLIYKTSCSLVLPMDIIEGVLELTSTHLYFWAGKNTHHIKHWQWSIDQLATIYRRTFLLRNTAIELFMTDRTNIFFNLPSHETTKLIAKIAGLHPPQMVNHASMSPDKIIAKLKLTSRWVERKISNFEYLMELNTLAGRTYNDLNQYPVFPWIISDYTSATLDLNNPAIYRDLSKPVGALEPNRLDMYLDRYKHFDDPQIPKFHYGTHYSSAGAVLFYLMRLEPFTSYFLHLNGGKFDVPERLFYSLPIMWDGCLTNNNNVKELIPEFFYLPEFLVNNSKIDFGWTKEGKINDVTLPPWASSPEEFVRINREALESEHVSAHLNEWIDLIFGFKQRGEEAEKSANLFFYLTYPGMIDIDSISDPIEKKSIESQILNFGQCPNQLFNKPHPKRLTIEEIRERSKNLFIRSITSAFTAMNTALETLQSPSPSPLTGSQSAHSSLNSNLTGSTMGELLEEEAKKAEKAYPDLTASSPAPRRQAALEPVPLLNAKMTQPLISVMCHADFVYLIFWDGAVAINSFTSNGKASKLFEMDRSLGGNRQKQIEVLISPEQVQNTNNSFVLADGKYVVSSGNWDNSQKVYLFQAPNTVKLCQNFVHLHSDTITCLGISETEGELVSASADGQVKVWDFGMSSNGFPALKLKHNLSGHSGKITCVDVQYDEDLVISGSTDKTCRIFTLQKGRFIRTLKFKGIPERVRLSTEGSIITLCSSVYLSVHSLNGNLVTHRKVTRRVNDILVKDEVVVTGGEEGVIVRYIHNLEEKSRHDIGPVRCLELSSDQRALFAGMESGELYIIPNLFPVASI
eukprot:TRINITY_DN6501_c0_g1_i3.p1 TRINITY_DN6501_c0_g1~~TRINITY_DN6501_c0_g1_i3.p1  ORF type:complete len:1773 (+),score=437.99 TRINITY_DN6501_c0_g1_i3:76-5394(+)